MDKETKTSVDHLVKDVHNTGFNCGEWRDTAGLDESYDSCLEKSQAAILALTKFLESVIPK